MKQLTALIIILSLFITTPCHALTKKQWETADVIAEVAAENYEKYGVLPSVAVAQAFIESTLGTYCRGNNLWGIRSGAESYPSLEAGVLRYLEVINNGYYVGAPFASDYRTQLRCILDGGYCQPVGPYYENATWSIEHYGFDKYDEMIPDMYILKYSKKCPKYTVVIKSKKAKKSTVAQIGKYFYETERDKTLDKNVILVPNKKLDGKRVAINLIENVKG